MTKSATVSKKPRKQQSPEFRSEALKLAERISVTAAARQLELYESQLYNWRSKIQQQKTSSERECQQRLKSDPLTITVIPPFLTEVISRIRPYAEYAASVCSHSTPYWVVRDYKTIAIRSHSFVIHPVM